MKIVTRVKIDAGVGLNCCDNRILLLDQNMSRPDIRVNKYAGIGDIRLSYKSNRTTAQTSATYLWCANLRPIDIGIVTNFLTYHMSEYECRDISIRIENHYRTIHRTINMPVQIRSESQSVPELASDLCQPIRSIPNMPVRIGETITGWLTELLNSIIDVYDVSHMEYKPYGSDNMAEIKGEKTSSFLMVTRFGNNYRMFFRSQEWAKAIITTFPKSHFMAKLCQANYYNDDDDNDSKAKVERVVSLFGSSFVMYDHCLANMYLLLFSIYMAGRRTFETFMALSQKGFNIPMEKALAIAKTLVPIRNTLSHMITQMESKAVQRHNTLRRMFALSVPISIVEKRIDDEGKMITSAETMKEKLLRIATGMKKMKKKDIDDDEEDDDDASYENDYSADMRVEIDT